MATIIVATGNTFENLEDENDGIASITVTSASSTQVVLQEPEIIGTYSGSFTVTSLTIAGISGTITGYEQASLSGATEFTVTGLNTAWSESYIGSTVQSEIYENADLIVSADGADRIRGYAGADTISGGTGDDALYGNADADRLLGNDGTDTVFGGQGADVIYGNAGGDALYGNLDADTVFGGQGDDTAFGGQGDDILYGNLASDALYGGAGGDVLFGGQGDDVLNGGADDDSLRGGLGNDTFVAGAGNDTIGDLDVSADRIQAASARTSTVDTADGALVSFADGSTVTLVGVSASSVTDTLFV